MTNGLRNDDAGDIADEPADDFSTKGGGDCHSDQEIGDELSSGPDGQERSGLRYRLTWGLFIAALALLGAYLLPPHSSSSTWHQALTEHTAASASSTASSHRPEDAASPTGHQPEDRAQAWVPSPNSPAGAGGESDSSAAVRGDVLVGSTAVSAPTSPTSSSSSLTPPADVLAGQVDDNILQQLLTQSMPERLGASDRQAATSTSAESAVQVAWQALSEDLTAGGWNEAHMQAHELLSEDSADRPGQLAAETTVVIMWSATSSAGEVQDRQMSAVRMDTTSPTARTREITTL